MNTSSVMSIAVSVIYLFSGLLSITTALNCYKCEWDRLDSNNDNGCGVPFNATAQSSHTVPCSGVCVTEVKYSAGNSANQT